MLWLAATLLASLPLAARGCAQQYWHRGRLLAEASAATVRYHALLRACVWVGRSGLCLCLLVSLSSPALTASLSATVLNLVWDGQALLACA